jgi:hypothetical protein
VLYGASINPESAAALLELDEVDGLLVGEASLRGGLVRRDRRRCATLSADGRGRPRRGTMRERP